MSDPSLSFVVIAFNEEDHIGTCLDGILSQDGLDSSEVIVVDDASSDRTSAIVEERAQRHPQVRLIRHPVNKGRGAARRTGQDATVGETVAFIDADILIPPNWLSRALIELESADAISGVAVPDGDCAVIWRIFKPKPKGIAPTWDLTGSNVIFRRAALEKVGWPAGSRLTEDNRMARAMVAAGFRVRTVASLQAEHHEAKTYLKTMAFMHETGFNATEILRDLRLFRFPDLVWLCWCVAVAASIGCAAFGVLPWWAAVAAVVVVTGAIDAGAMWQRFYFGSAPLRWIAATVANLPLITTYLVARTIYSPRLLLKRRTAEH